MLRFVLFCLGSFALFPLSWRSLRHASVHGFYRFFAFELLLALILFNAPVWFRDPLSPRQLVSYGFGAASIALAIEGFRLLRKIGKPDSSSTPGTNLTFENTTRLIATGVYRWIRHPLYASLLALGLCAYLKNPVNPRSILMMLFVGSFLLATAIAEQRENVRRFGAAYLDYMRTTKRFIPFLL